MLCYVIRRYIQITDKLLSRTGAKSKPNLLQSGRPWNGEHEKKQERAGPSRALSLSLSSCFVFEVPCLDMKIGTSFKILETDSLTEVDLATPSKPVQKSMLLLDALYRCRSHFGTPFAAPHNRNIRAFS